MSTSLETVTEDGRANRKLQNLLLNRRFQLKYTAMIVGVASTISIVLGVFLMFKVRENSRMLQLEAEFDELLQSQLADRDAQILWVLVGAFVLFNLVLALVAVLITHHMAGPIFVMRRYIQELGDGKLPRVRKLRKRDEFVELVDGLSEAVHAIVARTRSEVELMERLLSALPGSGAGSGSGLELRAELRRLLDEKRAMLARFDDPVGSQDLASQDIAFR